MRTKSSHFRARFVTTRALRANVGGAGSHVQGLSLDVTLWDEADRSSDR